MVKAGVQLGKVATRGGVAGVRGAGKVLGAAPGAVKTIGGALKSTGGGLLGAAKVGGAGLKRIPLIGSLLSAENRCYGSERGRDGSFDARE